MKAFLLVFVVLAVHFAASAGIQCSKQLCDQICQNPPTEEDCKQLGKEYRPHSSLCGCCATCLDYIPLFGTCMKHDKATIHMSFTRPLRHCQPGAKCVQHKCIVVAK